MSSGSAILAVQKLRNRNGLRFIKKIGAFGSAQLLIQALGMISGLLLVRLLPTHEYGLYTLALTMLGTMSVLADSGVTGGVMAEGGKVWKDRARLGEVIATGIALRRRFATFSLVVVLPLLAYLLHSHGASWLQIPMILAGVVLMLTTSLSDTIFQVAPKLQQQLLPLSKIQSMQSAVRLGLIASSAALLPFAFIALFASAIPQLWANRKLKALSSRFALLDRTESEEVRTRIHKMVWRTLPGAIFFCISGQVTILLIAFFGSTTSVAQVGALGRVAQLATLYTIMCGTILIPRFARLPADPVRLRKWFWGILAVTLAFGGGLVAAASVLTPQILWVLGPNYSGLKLELVLALGGTAVGLANGTTYSLGMSRGWIMNPAIAIPLIVIGQLAIVPFVDLGSVPGVLTFAILGGILPLVTHIFYLSRKISKSSV